jgi:outer membrane protein
MLKFLRSSAASVAAITLAVSSVGSAFAVNNKPLDQIKVAIVDVQSAILQTNEGKAAREKIEKEVSQKRQDLLNQQNNLKKLQEEFQAQQAVLSDADKQVKQKEFQAKLQTFQQAQMNFEQEAKQKEMAALQKIFQNIQNEVQKIAKEKSFDMVFDKSAAVLLYANNTTDITSDVVTKYNSDFKK